MKKLITMQSLIALTFIFPSTCNIIDTTKEKLYKSIEKPAIYNVGVYTIDTTAQLISNTIVKLTQLTGKEKAILQKINCRLNQITENIQRDEINAINQIYKEFNITDEDQHTINSILSQYKELQKQYLSRPHEKQCDTLESTSSEIVSLCKQMNIHPTAVELKLSHSPSPHGYVASTSGLGVNYQFENNTLIINKNDIVHHPAITLYPQFCEVSYNEQLATFGHELAHLTSQHHESYNILAMEIKYCTEAHKEEIVNSKSFKNLDTIHERQAEILYKDATWAAIMRNQRNTSYYQNHLFLKHYAQLVEIDELYKLKNKL
jgi:excinuclease UvrABC ATPase subunit